MTPRWSFTAESGVLRFDGEAGLAAVVDDFVDGGADLVLALDVERDVGRARLDELRDEFPRPGDHEMHVERQLGQRPDRLDDGGAESDVRHEMAVHDVDVEHVRAALLGAGQVGAQIAEIGGDDGRSDADGTHGVRLVHWLRHVHEAGDFSVSHLREVFIDLADGAKIIRGI